MNFLLNTEFFENNTLIDISVYMRIHPSSPISQILDKANLIKWSIYSWGKRIDIGIL